MQATTAGVTGSTEAGARRQLLNLAAAVGVGAVAVWLLRQPWAKTVFWPWLVLLFAMFMGAGALRGLELWLPGETLLPRLAAYAGARRRSIGIACFVAAVLAVAWVVLRLWPDYQQWHGTPAVWIAALVLLLLGAWLIGAVGRGSPRAATAISLWKDSRRNRWLELAVFTAIFILAVFLRTYRLDSMPPGIYVDETNGALDALYINEGRDASPFATGWYETPNGYLYYMAGMFRLFGANWYSLKFVSLIPAILTIPAIYLLARLLFGPLAGLSAMLLMAVSRWHLSMSRWGWNETAPPLFQILSFYFLIRGLRDRRALDYALSGMLAGLSVYTYLSSRLAIATLILYVIYWFLSDPSGFPASLKRSWLGISILAIAAAAAVAPIAVTYMRSPFLMNNRVSEISVFRDVKDRNSFDPLVSNVVDMLRFFHQTGDLQGKHNLPGEPMADPFTGLLFAIGVAYAILGWRDQRRVLLLLWLVIGLAGSFLSSQHESPQSYRSLTALPAVVMLAADVLDRIVRGAHKWLDGQSLTKVHPALAAGGAAAILVVALAGAAIWESTVYFGRQAHSIDVLRGFNPTENGVAHETISALGAGETVYLSPNFYGFAPLRFLLYGVYKAKTGENTLEDRPYQVVVPEVNLPVPDEGHDALILLDSTYWLVRGLISSLYPQARMEMVTLPDGSPNYMRVEIAESQLKALQGLREDVTLANGQHKTYTVPDISASADNAGSGAVTWTGALRLEHGNRYEIRPSEGLQVYIDGEPMDSPRYLGRGLYSLRVESSSVPTEGTGLSWKIGDADFVPIPPQAFFQLTGLDHGLLGTYWDNVNWEGAPLFHQVAPFLQLAWPDEQPIVPNGPFSARFTGKLHVTDAGPYDFKVEADDGARLTIDGTVLGEGMTAGQPNNFQGSMLLAAGDHPIQLDYFQQGGGSALRLYWRSLDQDWAPVPPEALIPAQP
ncbi:MAG TPA: PA14 domain-containing protein [Anaerolineales bacterium]|nr:PA14 domain-containing protein [Anaerolineales bacterium]